MGEKALTPLELQMMEVLWTKGASAVADVQQALAAPLAYTTVQTVLNVLVRKGRVRRYRVGKSFQYEPLVSEQKAKRSAVEDLIRRVFGGSAESLVMTMVDSNQIRVEELERLTRSIAAAERAEEEESGEDND